MHKSGMIYVGNDYGDAVDAAQKIVNAKNHPETVRSLLDAVTKDPVVKRAVKAFITDRARTTSARAPRTKSTKAVEAKAVANV